MEGLSEKGRFMPDSRMIQKAGKWLFLLVCLFLSTSCSGKKAVFEAGEERVKTEIYVAEEPEEILDEKPEAAQKDSKTTQVNINAAGAEELMTLPGIGKVRAAAIIEYRKQHGDFEKIEDIMDVKGIGTGIFSKINSLICVK